MKQYIINIRNHFKAVATYLRSYVIKKISTHDAMINLHPQSTIGDMRLNASFNSSINSPFSHWPNTPSIIFVSASVLLCLPLSINSSNHPLSGSGVGVAVSQINLCSNTVNQLLYLKMKSIINFDSHCIRFKIVVKLKARIKEIISLLFISNLFI